MKAGDMVSVMTNCVCYAPVESVGMDGVVVSVLDGLVDGVWYEDKMEVMFLEDVGGHRSWLYDESELERTSDLKFTGTRKSYKEKD
jgi:hypothetical protein